MAVGYDQADFSVIASVKDLSIFNTWIYQRVSKQTDIGVHITYDKLAKHSKYGLAGQYKIPDSDDSFVKVKINQDTLIGLVYGCTVNDGA